MINSVKPNLIVSDSRGAWFRATILFILALIGTVGMWSVVVFIPCLLYTSDAADD